MFLWNDQIAKCFKISLIFERWKPMLKVFFKVFILWFGALFGDFDYSQNNGGTFSDFLIFFSPWLFLLIHTSSSLKPLDKYPKSCPQVTQNHHFSPPFLSPLVIRSIFTFGSGLWGSYWRYDDNMGSFCDFGCRWACHI